MWIEMCKAKIHRAVITEANLEYEGSITIDRSLMDAAGLLPYEKVHVANIASGQRLDTYVIPADPGSGIVCLNGAAARGAHPGDRVIVMAFAMLDSEEAARWKPKVVRVDDRNRPIKSPAGASG
jgi:aspartate 1-decarboxylase